MDIIEWILMNSDGMMEMLSLLSYYLSVYMTWTTLWFLLMIPHYWTAAMCCASICSWSRLQPRRKQINDTKCLSFISEKRVQHKSEVSSQWHVSSKLLCSIFYRCFVLFLRHNVHQVYTSDSFKVDNSFVEIKKPRAGRANCLLPNVTTATQQPVTTLLPVRRLDNRQH